MGEQEAAAGRQQAAKLCFKGASPSLKDLLQFGVISISNAIRAISSVHDREILTEINMFLTNMLIIQKQILNYISLMNLHILALLVPSNLQLTLSSAPCGQS